MKARLLLMAAFGFFAMEVRCERTPAAVRAELYALSNYWGKAGALGKYYEARSAVQRKLAKYEDHIAITREWMENFLEFITAGPLQTNEWASMAGTEILMASFSGTTCTSTNCWLLAADYENRISRKLDQAEAQLRPAGNHANVFCSMEDKELYIGQKAEHVEAWNNYARLEKLESQTARAVTNVFPRWILPTLPPAEGAQLYTNVMRRAGLEPQRIEDLKPF